MVLHMINCEKKLNASPWEIMTQFLLTSILLEIRTVLRILLKVYHGPLLSSSLNRRKRKKTKRKRIWLNNISSFIVHIFSLNWFETLLMRPARPILTTVHGNDGVSSLHALVSANQILNILAVYFSLIQFDFHNMGARTGFLVVGGFFSQFKGLWFS